MPVLSRIIVLFIFLPVMAHAQQKCVLKGQMKVKDAGVYPYRVELDMRESSAKGQSVTNQDGTIVRTKVSCVIKREAGLMVLQETVALGKIPDSMAVCYINAVLRWKEKKGNVHFHGRFRAMNRTKQLCGEGDITLDVPAAEWEMKEKTTVPHDTKPVTDSPAPAPGKITEGTDIEYKWRATVCTLELWDAGVIDGDAVSVSLNGKQVLAGIVLSAEKKRTLLRLIPGRNEVVVTAIDEGKNPPNTVELRLSDDAGREERLQSFNKKGKTSRVILLRD